MKIIADLDDETMTNLFAAADKVVRTVCAIRPGERVLIVTNRVVKNGIADTEIISQALYDAVAAIGGIPVLMVQPEKSLLNFADRTVIEALKTAPDVCFSISVNKLGKDEQGIVHPYTTPGGQKFDHAFDFNVYGKKVMRSIWTPGVTLDMFCRTVCIDYAELSRRCTALVSRLNGASAITVTAPGGTDITVPVSGREPLSDDGAFSIAGTGGNIPAGEVFISPVRGSGQGTGCQGKIVFDGSMTLTSGDILVNTPITVTVRDGFVTDISGGDEARLLLQSVTEAEEAAIRMEKEGKLPAGQGSIYAENARNIGELGIGLNPEATISGNMLEDEKAFHTCHFAIGENYDGDAPSLIHLDGLVKNPTITVQYPDGQVYLLEKDGMLVE
jgi:hypothetical protein